MYKGRTFIREQIWVTGEYIDVDCYPVFQPAGKRRSKCHPTSDIQKRLNQKNREKWLLRLVRENFGRNDYITTLTFGKGNEPTSLDEAKRIIRNFLTRLRRRYKKAGTELKYIYTIERGKKNGRWHYHLFLSGDISRDEIETCWGLGYANTRRLQPEEDGLAALVHYVTKGQNEGGFRTWTSSKNLVRPAPAVIDGKRKHEEVEQLANDIEDGTAASTLSDIYPGYELLEASTYRNPINRGTYIHYELRRKKIEKEVTAK